MYSSISRPKAFSMIAMPPSWSNTLGSGVGVAIGPEGVADAGAAVEVGGTPVAVGWDVATPQALSANESSSGISAR
jgi:hypothetical protein